MEIIKIIGVLSGTAATLKMHLWSQLIPQADKQLLLLVNCKKIQKYQPMHTYMDPTNTVRYHLYPLEWKY